MREAMQWVHDRTVDGMNAGTDVHTLMREIRVPGHLDVGEGYGRTSWNVRAIWENYAGWFHHRSTTELYDVPAAAIAPDLVAAAGGRRAGRRRPGVGSMPANRLPHCTSPTSSWPCEPRSRPGPAHRGRRPPDQLLEASDNFWERAWLSRSLDRLEAR